MNILDTLFSHTICHFSSNLTDTCFALSAAVPSRAEPNIAERAKAVFKLQYVIDKKLKASKYFVFVTLEELRKV